MNTRDKQAAATRAQWARVPRIEMPGLLFSDEDADLRARRWHRHSGGYACTSMPGGDQYAHRLVLERTIGRRLVSGEQCDHINRNKLDNRRTNLRVASSRLQTQNRGPNRNSRSGLKGVMRRSDGKKWIARVVLDGVLYHLGCFDDPAAAGRVAAAKRRELGFADDDRQHEEAERWDEFTGGF